MSKTTPSIIVSGDISVQQARMLREQEARAISEIKPQTQAVGDDAVQTSIDDKRNFDQKIYMFPESYNALRREMVQNWPCLWQSVGHAMAFDAHNFTLLMNDALEVKIQFDTGKVESICHTYLNLLRKARGLSEISA